MQFLLSFIYQISIKSVRHQFKCIHGNQIWVRAFDSTKFLSPQMNSRGTLVLGNAVPQKAHPVFLEPIVCELASKLSIAVYPSRRHDLRPSELLTICPRPPRPVDELTHGRPS